MMDDVETFAHHLISNLEASGKTLVSVEMLTKAIKQALADMVEEDGPEEGDGW